MKRWRAVPLIALHYLRRVLADGAVVWSFLLPVFIVYVLGLSLDGLFNTGFVPHRPYRVALAAPGGDLGEAVEAALRARPDLIEMAVYPDAGRARESVAARERDAAVLVEEGDSSAKVVIVAPPGSVVAQALNGTVRAALAAFSGTSSGDPDTQESGGAEAEEEPGAARAEALPSWAAADSFAYFSFAIAVMFSMSTVHSAMVSFARDRECGAYARVRAAGVSRWACWVAAYTSSVAAGVLFFVVMALATRFLFGVRWGEIPSWLVLALAGAAFAAALSLALTAVGSSDPKRVEEFGSALFTVLAFAGGSTVPLHVMPPWFASAFAWLPNRALLDGFLRLSTGGSLEEIGGPLATLAWATGCLLLVGWVAAGIRTKEEM